MSANGCFKFYCKYISSMFWRVQWLSYKTVASLCGVHRLQYILPDFVAKSFILIPPLFHLFDQKTMFVSLPSGSRSMLLLCSILRMPFIKTSIKPCEITIVQRSRSALPKRKWGNREADRTWQKVSSHSILIWCDVCEFLFGHDFGEL